MIRFPKTLILIKGGGDLASGVAYRLRRAGFPLVMTELPQPTFVRRTVSYGEAVYHGEITVDGLTARHVKTPEDAFALAQHGLIPVLVDPHATALSALQPTIVVDAIMAKRNLGTRYNDAPMVIAIGPGFAAGYDCHAVIETQRGHDLGRVITQGQAAPNTGMPSQVQGYRAERVLRAPVDGHVTAYVIIGQMVTQDEIIAAIDEHVIHAPFSGVLRGVIHPSVEVKQGGKIGDVDPRGVVDHCFTISDKALAIGGGVVEAIFSSALVL